MAATATSAKQVRLDRASDESGWLEGLGSPVRFPVRAEATDGLVSMQVTEVRPGTETPAHVHGREEKIVHVVSGRVRVRVGVIDRTMSAGQGVCIPRGVPHLVANESEAVARVVTLLAPGGLESAFLDVAGSGDSGRLHERLEAAGVRFLETYDATFRHPEVSVTADAKWHDLATAHRIWLAGDTYSPLVSGVHTGSRAAVVHFEVPPGGGPLRHVHHRDVEIFHLLEGEIRAEAGGEAVTLASGDTLVLPIHVPHSFRNETSETVRMLAVTAPSGFERFLLEVGRPARRNAAPPAPDAAEKRRVAALGPKYGIALRPSGDI